MSMPSRVVGIDPSLAATGVADADGGLHTIRTKGKRGDPVAARALRLSMITARLRPYVVGADLMVIEGPAFGKSNIGTHQGAGLWWRIVQLAHAAGVRIAILGPSQLKMLATGHGKAEKADIQAAMQRISGRRAADSDQADAWWLRQAGLIHVGHPDALDALDLPQANRVTLDKVVWP